MTYRTLFQILVELMVLNIYHIRESNSIATLLGITINIYIPICIYFSYILISADIPSMAH